ncbi:polyphosphate polymerase domain-containing protein [Eubacteriaceae bacterium ES3]|nr:polyphosphate polymerase domain-containing protein [Eubacteriaceae bacterium ES3]
MVIKTFKRYEKKYQLTVSQYEQLLPILLKEMEPDLYTKENQFYSIYNIYFDTPQYDLIRHSLSKPYFKEKLRIRSYSIPNKADEPVFIELKKKIGGIVNKRRATIPLTDAYSFISNRKKPHTENSLDNQVLDEIDYFLQTHHLEPKAFISYDRAAYVGKSNPDMRITFDFNLKSRQFDLSLEKGAYGDNLIPESTYLMEVKIPGTIPIWLAHAFSELGIFSSSFSKYGTAYKNERIRCLAKQRNHLPVPAATTKLPTKNTQLNAKNLCIS